MKTYKPNRGFEDVHLQTQFNGNIGKWDFMMFFQYFVNIVFVLLLLLMFIDLLGISLIVKFLSLVKSMFDLKHTWEITFYLCKILHNIFCNNFSFFFFLEKHESISEFSYKFSTPNCPFSFCNHDVLKFCYYRLIQFRRAAYQCHDLSTHYPGQLLINLLLRQSLLV